MATYDDWKIFKWYCPNCGNLVSGCQNGNGEIKVLCKKCSTKMIRLIRSSAHETIEVYAPDEQAEDYDFRNAI